jgi:hypothetical protein
MRDGIQNIKSYKELPRQFLPAGSLVQKAGNVVVLHEDQTKPTEVHRKRGANPKYGAIFAFGANQDLDQLVDVFAKENASVSPEHRTDAVCVLDKGVILPVSSVTDVIAMAAYSEAHTGWAAFNDSIQALAFFCLHLLMHIMHTQLLRPDISRLLMPALNKANGRAVFPPGINPAGGNV